LLNTITVELNFENRDMYHCSRFSKVSSVVNLHRKFSSVLTFENFSENLGMPRVVTSPILQVGRFKTYYTYIHIYIYIYTDIDICKYIYVYKHIY